jgi:site-specific DNA-methyltransferase (adenine-specific)
MNKLYNDDCITVMQQLVDNNITVDCIVVDLPYFKVVKDEFDNQWKDEQEYLNWVRSVFNIARDLIKEDGNIIVFCSRQYARKISNIFDYEMMWIEKRQIIWARKRGFNNTRGHALASGYEPILYWTNGVKGTFNNIKIKPDTKRLEYTTGMLKDGVSLSDVWTDIPALPHNSKEKVAHPTQKPIKLMERIIEVFTNEGDTVLDFCMGSGSTGVACKNLNRDFIGIEINKEYFDIANNRINKV